jgi:hypothetical protein
VFSRLTTVLALLALLALAGCGGDNNDSASVSTTTVTASADEGSSDTADTSGGGASAEPVKALQDEVASLRDESGKSKGSSSGQSPSSAAYSATSCGAGVYVRSSNTSCAFALNVAADFFATPGYRFYSYSPVTGQTYLVRCTHTAPSLCRAGNGARILIT